MKGAFEVVYFLLFVIGISVGLAVLLVYSSNQGNLVQLLKDQYPNEMQEILRSSRKDINIGQNVMLAGIVLNGLFLYCHLLILLFIGFIISVCGVIISFRAVKQKSSKLKQLNEMNQTLSA